MSRLDKLKSIRKIKVFKIYLFTILISWIIWVFVASLYIINLPSYNPDGVAPAIYTLSIIIPIFIIFYFLSLIDIHRKYILQYTKLIKNRKNLIRTRIMWNYLCNKNYNKVKELYNNNYINININQLFIDGIILGTLNEKDIPEWGIDKNDMFNEIFK